MYIGSVRFFKHLILFVIALMIIVPTIGCVYFALQYNNLKTRNTEHMEFFQSVLAHDEVQADDQGNTAVRKKSSFAVYASDRTSETIRNALSYQLKYPHLFVENDFQYIDVTEKTAYFTFDDGPTGLTPQVLDILKDKGIKATFFVVYRSNSDAISLYKRIVDEGHALAIHSATHDYKKIYQSVEAFIDDFAVLSDMLEETTGVKPEIFRFPGGSINNYNKEIQQELISEMLRRGYTYYDWDVSSGSSTNTATTASVYSNVVNGVANRQSAIILMHDAGTSATVTALPGIIDSLKTSGYKFEVLDKKVRPTCFDYSN